MCSVAQSCLTFCNPMHCSPPGSFVGFSRQEYWSGLPFPSPGDLPDPGIEPRSPTFIGRHFNLWATREAPTIILPYFPDTTRGPTVAKLICPYSKLCISNHLHFFCFLYNVSHFLMLQLHWKRCASGLSHFSHIWLFVTLWTVVGQAFLPTGFYKPEYWSRLQERWEEEN